MKAILLAVMLAVLVACGSPTDEPKEEHDASCGSTTPTRIPTFDAPPPPQVTQGPIKHRVFKPVDITLAGGDTDSSEAGPPDVMWDTAPTAAAPPDLLYKGGPVLAGNVNIYVIWYGDWEGNTARTLIPAFIQDLSGSPYYQIVTDYSGHTTTEVAGGISTSTDLLYVANSLTYAKSVSLAYPEGKMLSEDSVKAILLHVLESGEFPIDLNGLYLILGSADVEQQLGWWDAFCRTYCGWHVNTNLLGHDIKYAYVGDTSRCPTECSPDNDSISPNGNIGADGMISVIAHEIVETVTDPDGDAWTYAPNLFVSQENADICAWTFGTTYVAPNGSTANMRLNGKNYLVQQNFTLGKAGNPGYCAMRKY